MSFIKKIIMAVLMLETRLVMRKYKPFVIAVTGSVGKTSTKDAIYAVIKSPNVCADQHICYVRKSEKSFNTEIGLPLTVLGVSNAWRNISGWLKNMAAGGRLIIRKAEYPDCLVLEVGADHPGDIKKVARWLKPDIAVITLVSRTPVHVEFFKSPEEVFEEKASLAEAVKPRGTVILFGDDEKVMSIADRVKSHNVSVISFGLSETAAVRATDIKVLYEGPDVTEWHVESRSALSGDFQFSPKTFRRPVGFSFMLTAGGTSLPVSIRGIIGRTYVYPLLAAAAVGIARTIAPDKIVQSLLAYDAPRGRMNIIPGLNESTLIDDTYNSSPDAALSALETLKALECSGTKIAVLGDMMELGKYSSEEHRRIGREAAVVLGPVGRLVTVGQRSRFTAEAAIASGMSAESVQIFSSASEAAAHLASLIKTGDIVLIKGSQSIRMERVAKALMNDPSKAPSLLVRQEKEWLEKTS